MFHSGSILLRALFSATVIVWVFFEFRQQLQHRPEATVTDAGSRFVVRITGAAGVLASVFCNRSWPSMTIRPEIVASSTGLIVMVLGVALRLWSFRTLGRFFTFTVQTSRDQPVIASGPYRVIRHPGYAGLLLIIAGIGLTVDNWGSFVALTAAFSVGLGYRIVIEERALSRDLGGRYQEYARSRKRLVPFIW
jgi:protein-S-isoprenylcysteine O-methyltransferase Ste14